MLNSKSPSGDMIYGYEPENLKKEYENNNLNEVKNV